MENLREISRLNLALELVSECAGLVNTDALARVVGERLRWLFDFDVCILALRDGDAVRWLSMRSGDEALSANAEVLNPTSRVLVDQAMASGTPSASGHPMSAIAHPLGTLGNPDGPLGVLCIVGSGGYTQRDLRFLHHVCSGLGTALSRIEQSDQLVAAQTLAANRARAASDEARIANEAKDTFLAMLGHELRNPLAPIIAATELLCRDASGSMLAWVQIVERQARHLDRLVEELLDVSRVTTGKINLHRLVIDLRDVALKAAEMARPHMLAKGQTLTMDLPDLPVMVDGDEVRLAQVGCNLLNNASAYSPLDTRVDLLVRGGVGEAVMEVRDEGIGIAAEMLPLIFEMFVQGHRSKEWAPGGLGLGLGVSRTLVELHGGSISVSSDGEGLGSAFRVVLPRLELDVAQLAVPTTNVVIPFVPDNPRKILLVDDNADAADSMCSLLKASGHDVLVAYGPVEALAKASAFAPEVAILDIGLPVMDGYQLAEELRMRLGAGAPAMIALSGYGEPRDRERSAELGFAAHFVKPLALDELLASVQGAPAREVPATE